MINTIWFLMIAFAIGMYLMTGETGKLSQILSGSAEHSIELLIGLAGVMAIWSGLMKICEKAGVLNSLSRLLQPVLDYVFPGLRKKKPEAVSFMTVNLAANMLGLSNAATPFGIKAMEKLQEINPEKERATDYMVDFLIINAACIQFLPTTVLSIMGSLKSENPTVIILPGALSALSALIAGLVSAKLLRKFFK